MYEYLRNIGISDIEHIDRFSLKTGSDYDVLKIYFKGDSTHHWWHTHETFQYPRCHFTETRQSHQDGEKFVTQSSAALHHVLVELESVCRH
jgi:hypothetical protein